MVDEIDRLDVDRIAVNGRDARDEVERRLVHVKYAAAAVGEAEHGLRDAVVRARHVGASWSQVAEALGISGYAAQRRFDGSPSSDPPGH